MQGTLVVTLIKAQIFKSTQWFGKMDPYATIQSKEEIHKTNVDQDSDINPVWNFQCSFRFDTEENNELLYKIFNSCTVNDDELGYGRCRIEQLYDYNGKEISMAIQKEGQPKGDIIMRFDYHLDQIKQDQSQQKQESEVQNKEELEAQNKALQEQQEMNHNRKISQTIKYKVQLIKDKLNGHIQQVQDEIKQLNQIGEQMKQDQKQMSSTIQDRKTQTKQIADQTKQLGLQIEQVQNEFTKTKENGFNGKLSISNLQLISSEKDSSWSKLDPYINIHYGNDNSIQTSVVDDGGNNCKWKDNITIEIKNQFHIHLELYDKCTFGSDKMLGVAIIPLLTVFSKKNGITVIPFNLGEDCKHKIQVQYDLA